MSRNILVPTAWVPSINLLAGFLKRRAQNMLKGHKHDWFRGCRVQDPPVDVFDCNCGARRYIARGSGLMPDEVYDAVVNPGGSPANAINVVTGIKMGHFAPSDTSGLPPPLVLLKG